MLQRDAGRRGELPQCDAFLLAALGDVGDPDLLGKPIHQRTVFSRDEPELQAGLAGSRQPHDIFKGKTLRFLARRAPHECAVGENTIHVHDQRVDRGQSIKVRHVSAFP